MESRSWEHFWTHFDGLVLLRRLILLHFRCISTPDLYFKSTLCIISLHDSKEFSACDIAFEYMLLSLGEGYTKDQMSSRPSIEILTATLHRNKWLYMFLHPHFGCFHLWEFYIQRLLTCFSEGRFGAMCGGRCHRATGEGSSWSFAASSSWGSRFVGGGWRHRNVVSVVWEVRNGLKVLKVGVWHFSGMRLLKHFQKKVLKKTPRQSKAERLICQG